jgi:hypothetical protein
MTCPDCRGTGTTVASHVSYADGTGASNVTIKCTRCHGTCEVDDRTPEWIKAGESMRLRRILANRSLREEAKRRGITAQELSRMEFGKVEPKL